MSESTHLSQESRWPRLPIAYTHAFGERGADPFLQGIGEQDITRFLGATNLTLPAISDVFDREYLAKIQTPGSDRFFLGHETKPDPENPYVKWSLKALGASLTAASLASQYGLGIARHGGFHHASFDSGQDLCVFSDILFVAHHILLSHPHNTIYVIDTDAHIANGLCKSIDKHDGQLVVYDLFNRAFESHLPSEHSPHYHPFPVEGEVSDRQYLKRIEDMLCLVGKAISKRSADFIIFVSGNDPLEKDPLGRMNISGSAIMERDLMVFHFSQALYSEQRKGTPPFLWLPGGGYSETADRVFGESARNVLNVFRENKQSLA